MDEGGNTSCWWAPWRPEQEDCSKMLGALQQSAAPTFSSVAIFNIPFFHSWRRSTNSYSASKTCRDLDGITREKWLLQLMRSGNRVSMWVQMHTPLATQCELMWYPGKCWYKMVQNSSISVVWLHVWARWWYRRYRSWCIPCWATNACWLNHACYPSTIWPSCTISFTSYATYTTTCTSSLAGEDKYFEGQFLRWWALSWTIWFQAGTSSPMLISSCRYLQVPSKPTFCKREWASTESPELSSSGCKPTHHGKRNAEATIDVADAIRDLSRSMAPPENFVAKALELIHDDGDFSDSDDEASILALFTIKPEIATALLQSRKQAARTALIRMMLRKGNLWFVFHWCSTCCLHFSTCCRVVVPLLLHLPRFEPWTMNCITCIQLSYCMNALL